MKLSHSANLTAIDLDQIDLRDPYFHGNADPHLLWHMMRREKPVYWQSTNNGLGFWSVTKMVDAEWVLRDATTFTSERGTMLSMLGVDDPAGGHQVGGDRSSTAQADARAAPTILDTTSARAI